MKPGERLALAVVIGIAVLAAGVAGAASYAWHSAGTMHVAIHEDGPGGTDLTLRLPGVLLEAAIALVPTPRLFDEEGAGAALAALEAFDAVAEQLVTMPDAVLVDIREGDARVRIEKVGDNLEISVREPGEWVQIDVPVRSVRKLAAKLGRVSCSRSAA